MLHELFSRFTDKNKRMMDLDLIFLEENTFKKILEESKTIKIAGMNINVPSLNHLIALKLHAIKNNEKDRILKDLPDVLKLINTNKIKRL